MCSTSRMDWACSGSVSSLMCPAQDSNHIFWVRKETSEGGISYGDLLGCPGLVSKGLHRKSQPQMFFSSPKAHGLSPVVETRGECVLCTPISHGRHLVVSGEIKEMDFVGILPSVFLQCVVRQSKVSKPSEQREKGHFTGLFLPIWVSSWAHGVGICKLPWTCCKSVHRCGQTWEMFDYGRDTHLRLLCPCGLVTWLCSCAGCASGCICALQGGVWKPGKTSALLGVQPPLSLKSSCSYHTWPVVLVGDHVSRALWTRKKHQTRTGFFMMHYRPPHVAPNLCTPTSAWCKSNPSVYFTIQLCQISGFERFHVPGCSADLSRAHVKSGAGWEGAGQLPLGILPALPRVHLLPLERWCEGAVKCFEP